MENTPEKKTELAAVLLNLARSRNNADKVLQEKRAASKVTLQKMAELQTALATNSNADASDLAEALITEVTLNEKYLAAVKTEEDAVAQVASVCGIEVEGLKE